MEGLSRRRGWGVREAQIPALRLQIASFSHSATLDPGPTDPAHHRDLSSSLLGTAVIPWFLIPDPRHRQGPSLQMFLPYSPTAPCWRSASALVASSELEPAAPKLSSAGRGAGGPQEEPLSVEAGRGGETVRRRSEHAQMPCVAPLVEELCGLRASQIARVRNHFSERFIPLFSHWE